MVKEHVGYNINEMRPLVCKLALSHCVLRKTGIFFLAIALITPYEIVKMYDEHLSGFILESLMYDRNGDRKLCDIEISCHGRTFHAHRCVLGSMSKYFYCNMPTKGEVMVVDCDEIQVETFEIVLDYFYSSNIELQDKNIYNLLYLAERLKIVLLEQMCVTYLKSKINMDTCLDMFHVCTKLKYQDLAQACFDFISDNFATVVGTGSFLRMHYDKLKHILELVFNDVSGPSDLDKYRAIKTWILFDINSRSGHGDEFLSLVDFPAIEPIALRRIFDEDSVLKKCRWTRKRMHRLLVRGRDHKALSSKKKQPHEGATVWLIGGESSPRDLIRLDLAAKAFRHRQLPCEVAGGGFCVRSGAAVFVATAGAILQLLLGGDQTEVTSQQKMRQINWQAAGAMINGVVYTHGGISGAQGRRLLVDDAIVGIDPYRGKITMRLPGAVPARYDHAAVSARAKLFVVGGRTCTHRVVADGYCFNPKDGSVRPLAAMKVARHRHALLVCNEGHSVLAIGGMGVDGRALASVECYDVDADRWRDFPALKIARHSCVATLIGRNMYVIGGARSEEERSWETSVEICRNFGDWSVFYRMPDTRLLCPCILV